MVILSDNSYLKVGLETIYNSKKNKLPFDLLILDAGNGDLYVMDFRFVNDSIGFEPISVFAQCRNSLYFRKSDIDRWHQEILTNRNIKKSMPVQVVLTSREVMVMQETLQGKHRKDIAAEAGISDKTVSLHKMNALRKLNMGSIAEFYSEYKRWEALWVRLSEVYAR